MNAPITSGSGSGSDVITFLKGQHEQIKAGFAKAMESKGRQREKAFRELRRLMAIHETAEEEVVHPAVARMLQEEGDRIVGARLKEERMAKESLAALAKLDIDSSSFEAKLASLEESVLTHAAREEHEEFERLAALLGPDRLRQMGKAVQFAESVAPTRPHPGVESAVANMVVGPFASLIDRTLDALEARR